MPSMVGLTRVRVKVPIRCKPDLTIIVMDVLYSYSYFLFYQGESHWVCLLGSGAQSN